MKFLDLQAQYHSIKKEIDQAINAVIERSDFIMGKEVEQLEKRIAALCGVKYGVGLNSGTDALLAALQGLGIGPGDEVIVPDFTYIATAEVICSVGAKPIFVDIDEHTYNIDPNLIKRSITRKTKAIIPVHLYGQPADMDPIIKIARKNKLFVIEDAAQAIGAVYKQKKIGSIGDAGCISFFPTKNLGAYGDAGMLVTNNKKLVDWVKKWRIHGQVKKYYTDFIGVSSRLDTIQAAILLVKLRYLNIWKKSRIEKAGRYNKLLKYSDVITPQTIRNVTHVYHQYTIRVLTKRLPLKKYLARKGIPVMEYYPVALHHQKAFKFLKSKNKYFPISDMAASSTLSLPIYPELAKNTQNKIISEILHFYKR